jgi:hypothetical protein
LLFWRPSLESPNKPLQKILKAARAWQWLWSKRATLANRYGISHVPDFVTTTCIRELTAFAIQVFAGRGFLANNGESWQML